mmetsp:Transcript_16261/g.26829  ORF Transcript_16261/g.26829 Transcript_16261/m.26829 type:complete len:86 (+) Transcript_16261:2122-2379(+)
MWSAEGIFACSVYIFCVFCLCVYVIVCVCDFVCVCVCVVLFCSSLRSSDADATPNGFKSQQVVLSLARSDYFIAHLAHVLTKVHC